MSRSVGVLKAPVSSVLLLFLNRPASGSFPSIPMPTLWYCWSVNNTPSWQLVHFRSWKSFYPRLASPLIIDSFASLETIVGCVAADDGALECANRFDDVVGCRITANTFWNWLL